MRDRSELPARDGHRVEILARESSMSTKVCFLVVVIHDVSAETALTEIAHVGVEIVFSVKI